MPRRLHVPLLHLGFLALPPDQLHHIRNVLRIADGTNIDLFDNAGHIATGTLQNDGVEVHSMHDAVMQTRSLIIASAVPKGDRADWMIEKLSELGVTAFVPLAAERSVVLPQGQSKHQRWQRIAIESAKQSRRPGIMRIDPLTAVLDMSSADATRGYLSTAPGAVPMIQFLAANATQNTLLLYVGPEGGWTERECAAFDAAGLTAIKLTDTILRIETAAICAAAIVLAFELPSIPENASL